MPPEAASVIGGGVGIAIGLVAALLFPIVGDAPEWEVAGCWPCSAALVGAWSASMIGISIPSPRLARFDGAIGHGQILLMVDLPPARVQAIEALLSSSHPEARFEGEERLVPRFPEARGLRNRR